MLVAQYENLRCLIHSLTQENANNSNTGLLHVSEWITILYLQIIENNRRYAADCVANLCTVIVNDSRNCKASCACLVYCSPQPTPQKFLFMQFVLKCWADCT